MGIGLGYPVEDGEDDASYVARVFGSLTLSRGSAVGVPAALGRAVHFDALGQGLGLYL